MSSFYKEDYCDAAACAAGSAALHPWFNKQGLKLSSETDTDGISFEDDFHALGKFFGLEYEVVNDIFGPWEYSIYPDKKITPLMVANRIRKYLNGD